MPDRLEALHRQIEDLTEPNGEYAVVCPYSGKRPVPVRGKSFPTAAAATDAADLVVEYRKLLREVDPHLENIPIVATEEAADPLSLAVASDGGDRERDRRGEHSRSDDRDRPGDSDSRPERERSGDSDRPRRAAGGHATARGPTEAVRLSGDGDEEWLRLRDAPVVRLREDGEPLDDAVVGLELNSKL